MALEDFPHSSPDQLQRAAMAAAGRAEDAGATADTKRGKAEANYRPAGSSNTRCERCVHFAWSKGTQGRGTCRLVAGAIASDHVSDLYESGRGSSLMDLITNEPTR